MCPCSPLIPPNPPLKKGGKKDKLRKGERRISPFFKGGLREFVILHRFHILA
ncbi:MAG: hypothetical protein JETT_0813 [Candidatus Jettenia ecosi]|uniref:Uncharacterized protein n=1 Tax=Candidatus Jettenia ecosi TaxID=2494326 RepID=A0A533QDT5_9BACT|nr:MAG: hypothetical protein JETT_0813 [Candidatus Jettenia ecosi]